MTQKTKIYGKSWESLSTVGRIPRNLERAEVVALFHLTTGHDFLGVYLHCFGLAADETCPLCGHARMDGDHLHQCTRLNEYLTDDILDIIQGPTNFLDLKTVGGQELETFRQVWEKSGFLEDDNHSDVTMEEAVLYRFPSQIRVIFNIDMYLRFISKHLQLWYKYKIALSEDILHRFETMDQQ
ncbi:ATP-dependent DNA helicase [Trichonephila clavipes]|nr:ATP-dependent DNA helicase [Trichonephila clavipes]